MTARTVVRVVLRVTVSTMVLAATAGYAQDVSNAPTSEDDAIVVTGVRGSLARALDQKRNSDGIVDGISSEDIADFPDLNISEALARVTGVTISRSLGEGQQVTVRGLAPEFTQVTINGQTVTSGNAGREVDFDIFASELFTSVQIYKSPSAQLQEGGLAGTIDMRTARPFDFKDPLTISLVAQGAYNDRREEVDPRASALVSWQNPAGTFGVLGSLSYSDTSLRADAVEGFRFISTNIDIQPDGMPEVIGAEFPFIPRYVLETFDRQRIGVTGAVQFRPSDSVEINFDALFSTFSTLRERYSIDGFLGAANFRGISGGLPQVDESGLIVSATLNNVVSRSENIYTPEEEDLLLLNLDGTFRFGDDWALRLKGGLSDASRQQEEFRSVWQIQGPFRYDYSDRTFVEIEQLNASFDDPAAYIANQSRFTNFDISDREWSAQGVLEKSFSGPFIRSVDIGARYSDRTKAQDAFDGRLTFNPLGLRPGADIIGEFPVDDFFAGYDQPQIVRTWFVPDFDAVFADETLTPDSFVLPQQFTNSFSIDEATLALFAQLDFDGDFGGVGVRGNLGGRYITTDQTSSGFNLVNGAPIAVSIPNSYDKFLPSFNLVVEPTNNLLLRLTASQTLTRPTLTSLQPGGNISPTARTASLGNPELSPFTADQIDAAIEWYFAPESLLSFTYFYKNINGFIAPVTVSRPLDVGGPLINDSGVDVNGEVFSVSQPVNGEAAKIDGFEIAVQVPFLFLPEPLDGFGVLANYTRVNSSFTINFEGEEVTTRIPGQSANSYNLVGYYEKGPFSVRLAYSWRDEFLSEFRPRNDERSNFIDAYGQLDGNIQYSLTDKITLTLDMLNLLDEPRREFSERSDRVRSFQVSGRFFLLGARAKF